MSPLDDDGPRKRRRTGDYETGPYIARPLLEQLPLEEEGVGISCVEFWESNLYIGTTGGELLHYVRIPSDDGAPASPTFILASRVRPEAHGSATDQTSSHGVQQILVLPKVGKACVLCHGAISFYSLPELSPAFESTHVRGCNWIGGIDLDLGDDDPPEQGGELVMICLRTRMRLVRISQERLSLVRNIEFPGCLSAIRRGSVACVANGNSYALLDVDHQQKIPLFPISSLQDQSTGPVGGRAEDIATSEFEHARHSSVPRIPSREGARGDRGHGRSTSLGAFVGGLKRSSSKQRGGQDRYDFDVPEAFPADHTPSRSRSPGGDGLGVTSPRDSQLLTPDKPLPPPPPSDDSRPQSPYRASSSSRATVLLQPKILSPTPSEFLLLTGTQESEPGVGIFVNLDGDVCRSTMELERYPEAVVLDNGNISQGPNNDDSESGYVLAASGRPTETGLSQGLEIQRWDVDPGEAANERTWLNLGDLSGDRAEELKSKRLRINSTKMTSDISVPEVCAKLILQRVRISGDTSDQNSLDSAESSDSRTKSSVEHVSKEIELFESQSNAGSDESRRGVVERRKPSDEEIKRNKEEEQFAQRLAKYTSRLLSYSGDQIWLILRTPLVVRLDAELSLAQSGTVEDRPSWSLDRQRVLQLVESMQREEPRNEADFLSLGYVRQKAGLLLFVSVLRAELAGEEVPAEDLEMIQNVMIESGLDPRVILLCVPGLRDEVVEGQTGLWLHGGIRDFLGHCIATSGRGFDETLGGDTAKLLGRFLTEWRRKKGFGSISNETEVFQTVDAALLRLLLKLISLSEDSAASKSPFRRELHTLVDQGVDCVDRAVTLLEESSELYVLSRLYQGRKMPEKVLSTWRRIMEGEKDASNDFEQGEMKMRKYVANNISDAAVVQEYATWLSRRSPKIGVQIFADDSAKVKFAPAEVVSILEKGAPAAVKEYLEYLVFVKRHTNYVNDLIGYYLDSVLSTIEGSDEARGILAQSYVSYRALRPPRPTYRSFVTDNAVDEDWWRNRLRLLELLGGSHGAAAEYDVSTVLKRIEPFEQELVPEMIILDGRQGRHGQALRLLTHGLRDYDTALNYCLLGGSSIFHPSFGGFNPESAPSREEQSRLFAALLHEFLQIDQPTDQVEQTSNLLERFGGWFDIDQVLTLIPDAWSVEIVSGFLISAFRRIVKDRNESMVAKSLSGAENLKVMEKLIDQFDRLGPTIDR